MLPRLQSTNLIAYDVFLLTPQPEVTLCRPNITLAQPSR